MTTIRHLICILAAACLLAGCGLTERITHTRSVQVDTIRHHVPLPGHVLERRLPPADSITLEDERLRITIWRPADAPPSAGDAGGRPGVPPAGAEPAPPGDSLSGGWQIRAEVKPDTAVVAVPRKTITEEKETTKFVKQTPGLVKYLIGGLVAIILVLVVAYKFR